MPPKPARAWLLLLALLAAVNVVRFVRLDADFPPGVTTSRTLYTDEGMYSANGARIGTGQSWYIPREMNAIIDLPVVPILQGAVFRIFGTSLVAARGLVAVMSLVLIGAAVALTAMNASMTCAALVAIVLSLDFLLFSYSRLAVFDVIMTTIMTLAFAAASSFRARHVASAAGVAGALLGVAALTKTTALCGLPALAYLCSTRVIDSRRKWKLAGLTSGVCALVVLSYNSLAKLAYPADYDNFYRMAAGRLPGGLPRLAKNLGAAVFDTVRFDPALALIAVVTTGALMKSSAGFRANVLVRTSVLWVLAFLAMQSLSSYQPSRYFVAVVVPLVILCSIAVEHLGDVLPQRLPIVAARAAIVGGLLVYNAVLIADYFRHPAYTFERMAREVGDIVRVNDSGRRPGVLLGDMAPSVSLHTGVTAISMGYGTVDLAARIAQDCPTHFITLQTPSEDEDRALSPYYVVEPVKEWDVFENYYEHRQVRLSRLRPRAGRLPSCPASP